MVQEFEGGCLCGATRYRATGEPRNCCICHCRSCRLAAGAPGVAWATFPLAALHFHGEEPACYASSPRVKRRFCARCGTALCYWHEARGGEVDLALATLDNPAQIAPKRHIWMADAADWERRAHELPRHERWRGGP